MPDIRIIGSLDEVPVWAIVIAVISILVSLVVSAVMSYRVRSAGRAKENETTNSLLTRIEVLGEQHLQKYNQLEDRLETRFGSQIKEVGQAQLKLQEIEERSNRQQLEIRNLRMRAALQQAVSRGLKARIHLAEQSSGLAERDLTEAGSALQSAFGIAPKELKPRIEETIRSLNELKQSVEARTFPVASVEMMTDRIDALIVVETIGD